MELDACCFSGHRIIPPDERAALDALLDRHIGRISGSGVRTFICGGALGFDTMAARSVLRAREGGADIRLLLAIPYRGMEQHMSAVDRREFESILARADDAVYTAEIYDRGCMLRRDRYMVDKSSICVSYMTKNTGGTAYTVGYALKKGLEVINLALEL